MTGTRTSFTCDTINDLDIIDWLDSFGSRERGFAIKAAIRSYMMGETTEPVMTDANFSNLASLEEKISNLYHEVVTVRKQNEKLLALSINNDIMKSINKDLSDGEVDSEVMNNIGNLFKED